MTPHGLLHPTDFSHCADHALHRALVLARRHDAHLHVIHVAPPEADISYELDDDPLLDELELHVEPLLEQHGAEDITVELAVLRADSTIDAITEYAQKDDIDLIVMGTHGRRGVERLVTGSTTERVIRRAPCPVLAVRQRDGVPPGRPIRHVVVPVDFSDHSRAALRHAASLASSLDARLTLLHAVESIELPGIYGGEASASTDDDSELHQRIREGLAAWRDEDAGGLPGDTHVATGSAAGSIIDYAADQDADLIVMSTHGRTGLRRFLIGNITEKVLRQTPCPLLVVQAFDDGQGDPSDQGDR